jgi:hypothetical protein
LAAQTQAQEIQAYLFSTWTSPANDTAPPFTFTGTDGVKLCLNGRGVAIGQEDIADPISANIDFAFHYLSHSGKIDRGEGVPQHSPGMASHVDREIRRLDDVGLIPDGRPDALLNLDFGPCAKVVFKKFDCTLSCILIAEDGGLDPLKLEWDADGNFCSGAVTLFNGFKPCTLNAILNRPDFGSDDCGSDVDQIYLFTFPNGLQPGYLRITEIGGCTWGGTRLEVDFAGGSCIPEPNTVMMVGAAIGLLGMTLRRRR